MRVMAQEKYRIDKALSLRTSSRPEIEAHQGILLKHHLQHAAQIPFYRQQFQRTGVDTESIHSLEELSFLPFTTRKDIDNHPELFGITNEKAIRDIALTSGTTGAPVKVPYTEGDLARLSFNEAVAFYSAGVRSDDRVLLTVTLDRCFIAGLAYYTGVTLLGAAAIRSGPGQPARQWEMIRNLEPTVIVGVPSFLLELGRWGISNTMNVSQSPVTKIITIGEPARKTDCSLTPVGLELEDIWGAQIFSSYGATELETAFGECVAGRGGHIHPELMLVEIVDDENNILPDGEAGEIVVTPLGVEGFPLVRFRTGDVGRLIDEKCSCGWNTKRLGPIEGRLAQRLKFKGTTFYPETIFHALQEQTSVKASFVEVRSGVDGADEVTVVVGCEGEMSGLDSIRSCLQAHLRVLPRVVCRPLAVVLGAMQKEGGRKPKKFFDFRTR